MREHTVYDGITHRERYHLLINLFTLERANNPHAIQHLERELFLHAAINGFPVTLPALSVPTFPPGPSGASLSWFSLVVTDGRFWYAHI
jgi:hypothetical protein